MKLTINGTPAEVREFLSLAPGQTALTPPAEVVVHAPVTPSAAPPVAPEPHLVGGVPPQEAFDYFRARVLEWVRGFEQPDQPQPDRIEIIREMGSGRLMLPIMQLALNRGSLQKLIAECLHGTRDPAMSKDDWLDFIQRISAQMVAVSHMGFPDLAGMHDYSSKWRRTYVD